MPYTVDWGNTPIYQQYKTINGTDEGFCSEGGTPQFPINALMWTMMIAQMGNITTDNAEEVYARMAMYYAIVGDDFARLYDETTNEFEPVALQPIHVAQCVGLSVNVSTKSRTEWVSYCEKLAKREGVDMPRSEITKRLKRFIADFRASTVNALAYTGWEVK